ncbi:MAG: isoleucine--tRNA ligase [Proteobacteria bacterium]|nr:isoleucine--tRNA ligase [Pseudomonadota bacterium]
MFSEVSTNVRFPLLEEEILTLWREQSAFQASLDLRKGAPEFVFYEGPPTANGRPGVHHIQARAYKDLFPRYKTMQGFLVNRKAGWDCHGLPVELEVEKRLGFSGKQAIEAYGVEPFNKQCRASVMEYEQAWRQMTERIGYWVDLDRPYMTMSNDYVESVWWSLRQLWDKGLVYLGYKVVPYCPRCGTPLSSHEVGLGYKDVVDPSITIRFTLKNPASLGLPEGTSLLVWTTTPWTLPGNVAAAVNPGLEYVAARRADGDEIFILARSLMTRVLGEDAILIKTLSSRDLAGKEYIPPFPQVGEKMLAHNQQSHAHTQMEEASTGSIADADLQPSDSGEGGKPTAWYIVTGDFVTAEDGTGIVHIAPAFGADDMDMSRVHGLPVLRTVDGAGHFLPEVELPTDGEPISLAGELFKSADKTIIRNLRQRGILFAQTDYKHAYPHCWRCSTALMYYATNSWFIANTRVRDRLIEKNQEINWVPAHIKNGRYGDWLDNLVDWALSRSRYWGTPLPIWICGDCSHRHMVGSYEELGRMGRRNGAPVDVSAPDFDPHRPYVDEIVLTCDACEGDMHRISDVIDCWYDSGAMPFAQVHYPFENADRFDRDFPASFICEGLDQTRGWFNSLHQLGVMLFDDIAYRTVICHGLVLDEEGNKMSKSRGNVVDPWEILNAHGADAMRWYLYSSAPPEASRRFSVNLVGDAVRKYILTLWNTYAFFVQNANEDKPDLKPPVDGSALPLIDRWAIARLQETVAHVTEALDSYDPTTAARALEAFVDDLSNWYVRRNRRRFWEGDGAAYHTLYTCLVGITRMTAPFTPFLAEALHQNLVRRIDPSAPASVHLCDYPKADGTRIDQALLDEMRATINVVSLGRAARQSAKLKTRQPLIEAVVAPRSRVDLDALRRSEEQLREELNVKQIRFLEPGSDFVTYRLRPNLPVMGKKYGKQIPAIKKALESISGATVAAAVRESNPFDLPLEGGETLRMQPDEVLIDPQAPEGYAYSEGDGRLVALDTRVTEALQLEGLSRDLIRNLNDLRKKAGLHISDQIAVWVGSSGTDVRAAVERFNEVIAHEVQARELHLEPPPGDAFSASIDLEGETVTLGLVKR